jgi:hypothetical protein
MGVASGALIAAGVTAAATAYSANKQAGAAKAAGNKAQSAADAASAATEQNYQRTQTNLSPYISAGNDALTKINAVNNGDYSGFMNSPDYLAARDQGIQAQDRSAAARGSLYSGGHSADLAAYAGNLATQNLNNYYSRLTGLAALGQNSATGLGSIGNGAAAQSGNFQLQGASAQGRSAYNQANIGANLTNQLGGLAGSLVGQWGQTSPTASSYGTPSAQANAGLLGGANYTGPNSLSTGWSPSANGYLAGNY